MSSDLSGIADAMKASVNVAEATSGIKASKTLNFQVGTGFSWRDPPLSWAGYIYPTDSTYHPLLNHSNYEIATNLYSVEGSGLPEDQKNIYKNKIKDIVESSYEVKTWGGIYFTLIIFAFIILLVLLFIIIDFPTGAIFSGIAGGVCFIVLLWKFFGLVSAKGKGIESWQNFEMAFNAAQSAGSTPLSILDKLKGDDRYAEEQLQKKYEKAHMPENSSLAGSILSGVVTAAILGFSKK